MKKLFCTLLLLMALCSLRIYAAVPDDAIKFIYDGHLYFQAIISDTIPVTLIYDTGADFLYLDEDYIKLNNLEDSFGKKDKAQMRGTGNSDVEDIIVFIDPIKIHCGNLDYENEMTPVIKLRDILGRYTDGMLGNTHLLQTPLQINFTEGYIKRMNKLEPDALLDGYHKLEARFNDNRIDVKAKLNIDSEDTVEGWFRLDLGCGSAVVLTNETSLALNLEDNPKAYFTTQAGGVGGSSDDIVLRASSLKMGDTFENLVIDCSLNKKGALSSDRPYVGIIGNEIWSLYDMILDPLSGSVWLKRNNRKESYSQSSTSHMAAFDRTDITDGWIVNGLYIDGIAQKCGFEIGDVILSINGRPVKEISWEEQRNGLGLEGETKYEVRKQSGKVVTYTLFIHNQII